MKKETKVVLIIILILLIVLVAGMFIFNKINNYEEIKRLSNIEGKYSDVIITDIDSAKESIREIQSELKINSIDKELKEIKIDTNSQITNTFKLQQVYNDVEVYKKGPIVYTEKDGTALGIINSYMPIQEFNTSPKHSNKDLEEIAISSLSEYETKELQDNKLIIYTLEDGSNTLAYEYSINIGLTTATVIVSDSTEKVLEKTIPINGIVSDNLNEFKVDDISKELAQEASYTINGEYALVDKTRNIVIGKMNSENLNDGASIYSWNTLQEAQSDGNQLGINTMNTLQQVYDYYVEKFDYNSFDNENIMIDVITGVTSNNKKEDIRNNAFFIEPNIILFGSYNYYNESIEVIGHEFTHGVFYHTVGPYSTIEMQALNEAYADIMGMCIEAYYENASTIDGFINESPNQGVKRDIANSKSKYNANRKDKGLTGEKYEDSTIISRATYLMSDCMTLEEFETLWFNSMKLLPLNCDFYYCEYAVIRMAKYMNLTEEQQDKIRNAFEEVGLVNYDLISQDIKEYLDENWNNNSASEENNIETLEPDIRNTTFEAGGYTLHYGTYKGTDYQATGLPNTKIEVTIVLNSDGTYTKTEKLLSTGETDTSSGKFEIQDGSQFGDYYARYKILSLSSGSMYMISADDTLEVMAGSGARFTYQGD